MECFCYLRNIQDKLEDGKSPYEARFGTPFDGPVIPLGVDIFPISTKDTSRLHRCVTKMRPGILIGHALKCGGRWTRDV